MPRTCPACARPLPDTGVVGFCPSCGRALSGAAPSDPLVGQVLASRYEVQSVLAEGGMGRVYVATQRLGATVRRVAIKVMLPEHADQAARASRFLHEVGLAAQLEHPNTVRVYDVGRLDDGRLFVAMELLQGEVLSAVLARGPLPLSRVLAIIGQVCGSLAEAHRKGIVHRDIKPENVMLCRIDEGELEVAKVLDFGIARTQTIDPTVATSARLTRQGELLGTPEYMSPEQVVGGEIDTRSDVYSLGVMTFEMIVGRLPFVGGDVVERLTNHLTATPLSFDITEAGRAAPEHVRRAVLRALSKRREDRQSSVRELYAELAPFTEGASSAPWSAVPGGSARAAAAASPSAAFDARPGGTLVGEPNAGGSLDHPVERRRGRRWIGALALGAALIVVSIVSMVWLGVVRSHAPVVKPTPSADSASSASSSTAVAPPPSATALEPLVDLAPFEPASLDVTAALAKGCDGAQALIAAVDRVGAYVVKDAAYQKLKVNAGKLRQACDEKDMTDAAEHEAFCADALKMLRRLDQDAFTLGSAKAMAALAQGCDGAGNLIAAAEALGDAAVNDLAYEKLKLNAVKHRAACSIQDMSDVAMHRARCAEALKQLKRRP